MSLTLAILFTIDTAVSIGILWYLKYRKLDEIESYFTENVELQRNRQFWSWNKDIDKEWRVGFVMLYLVLPKEFIRRGEVTQEELASIPPSLKRWFIWSFYWGTLSVIAMFAWLIWAKVR